MSPETVLKAARLIRRGEVIELGHALSLTGGSRRFELFTKPTIMNGPNRRGSTEEVVVSEIGHVGTQLDGFGHQSIGNTLYNCYKLDEVATRTGFKKLGLENVGALMTRGVLIDVAALKGMDVLPDAYEITVQDLQQALQKQKLMLQSGDAVIIYTGLSKVWGKPRNSKGSPGIGIAAAEWLVRQDPMLVGADNGSVEVSPNPDPKLSLPVHQIMLAVNGIYLVESLKLDELATKQVHEFAFVVQPLKIVGGTGSTIAPIAIR
jgi:kynurenine formamidase